jgi:hypothetical protein
MSEIMEWPTCDATTGKINAWCAVQLLKHSFWLVILVMMCIYPICSMYGIFTYIWVFFGANVGKYSIHGAYGYIYITLYNCNILMAKESWFQTRSHFPRCPWIFSEVVAGGQSRTASTWGWRLRLLDVSKAMVNSTIPKFTIFLDFCWWY